MRIKVFIRLLQKVEIPPNSRQTISYLIKSALEKSNSSLKERLYNNENKMKPFTFSVYFPFKQDNKKELVNNSFSIIFSSNDYEFLISIYNGLLELGKNGYKIFNSPLKVERFLLLPEKSFTNNEAIFKTLSPFMVRNPQDGDKYLYPVGLPIKTENNKDPNHWKYWEKSDNFVENLHTSLTALIKEELPYFKGKIEVELINGYIVPILHGSNNRYHQFKMTFPGIKGVIKIKGDPEVLKLFYDIGIGARRSEGFGMLEVVE